MSTEPQLVSPDSVLNWSHDWTDWLPASVTISTRQWSITPSTGITLTNDTAEIVTVSGFTSGKVYRLKETVVLSDGEEDSREILLRCQ